MKGKRKILGYFFLDTPFPHFFVPCSFSHFPSPFLQSRLRVYTTLTSASAPFFFFFFLTIFPLNPTIIIVVILEIWVLRQIKHM